MNLPWKGLSLRWKLVAGSALIEIAMLAVLVVNNVRLIDESLREQVELRLRELSVLLNAAIAPSMAELDYGSIQGVFAQSRRKGDIAYFVLFDRSGKRVAGDGWASGVPLPKAQRRPDTGGDAERFDTEIPIGIGGQSYGRLQFGISAEFVQLARERLVRQSLTIATFEIALSIVLLAMLGIWLTRHLAKLEAASIAVGQGDFDVAVEVSAADEIGRVAQAFNRMTLEIKHKLAELSKSEARFRALIEHAPDAIVVTDIDTQCIVDANLQAEKLFGRSREELLSGGIERFYAPLQPDGLAAGDSVRQSQLRAVSGESVLIERSVRRPSGEELILEVRVDDMSSGGRRLARGSFIDISERKRAEASLHLAASVFAHAREGIVILDAAGRIVEVNDAFTHITGYSRDEARGRSPRFLGSDRQSSEFYAALWHELTSDGHWSGELWNQRKDGEVYPDLITMSAVRDAAGKTLNYVALFSDITALKEHQNKLEHIAHYDALTGMPNRVLLADRLKQAIAQTRRRERLMALVYLDLDGFKAVNDSHGHETGDQLLIAVAQRLKEALREGDTLARLGGDEFAAVLTDLGNRGECELVLTRLLQAAAAPVQVRERTLQVSASIGVTLYPLDDGDADLLLRHADQAMYLAKQAGKNRYHLFDVDQDVAVKTQHESLEHVRHALD